jgi:Xaa-Pro aminopeptidase
MSWINGIRSKARAGAHPPGEFLDLDHLLHELRLFKSREELALMRGAAHISARAHRRAMQHCRAGMREYELEAELLYGFVQGGARHAAYNSIVGGGENACVLHYIDNNAILRDGDLVLVDAGCELDHYAADLTRTWPVNGRFRREQRALYEVVLAAQRAGIREVRSGARWNQPHDATVQVITDGLRQLGLLDGELQELVEREAYKAFYAHRAGHWLGMDVHDVGDYKLGEEWRVLEPGMVLTVEPGIYIAADNRAVAKRWRGIGIRIEDAVAVTRGGPEVLSVDAPKAPEEIEMLMAQGR